MCAAKIAVVTGGNKGIGFGIVKSLCERFEGLVYLTARDVGRGEAAVEKLRVLGLRAIFFQLDITDENSIENFADYITHKHGGIDILINNAGVQYKNTHKVMGQNRTEKYDMGPKSKVRTEKLLNEAKETFAVNYYGLIKVCDALFPLLRENARVINISSSSGHLSKIPSLVLKKRLSSSTLTVTQLNELMEKYLSDLAAGNDGKEGWPESAYIVSKVGVSALTIIQQKQFERENPYRNIVVNSVHPGFVDTDMSHHEGPLTIEEGTIVPLFLALDDHDFRGKFIWCDKTEINWYSECL